MMAHRYDGKRSSGSMSAVLSERQIRWLNLSNPTSIRIERVKLGLCFWRVKGFWNSNFESQRIRFQKSLNRVLHNQDMRLIWIFFGPLFRFSNSFTHNRFSLSLSLSKPCANMKLQTFESTVRFDYAHCVRTSDGCSSDFECWPKIFGR